VCSSTQKRCNSVTAISHGPSAKSAFVCFSLQAVARALSIQQGHTSNDKYVYVCHLLDKYLTFSTMQNRATTKCSAFSLPPFKSTNRGPAMQGLQVYNYPNFSDTFIELRGSNSWYCIKICSAIKLEVRTWIPRVDMATDYGVDDRRIWVWFSEKTSRFSSSPQRPHRV
jgi:hypothetical protein